MKFSRSSIQLFYSLAVVAFVLSALAHGATLFGRNPHQRFPNIWVLHLGMFIVCIPAFLASKELAAAQKQPKKEYWKLVLSHAEPQWCGVLYTFCGYALVNFFVCMTLLGFHKPGQFHGQPALISHGHLIRLLSATEFQRTQSLELRLFSGHWMAFYLAAATILRSVLNATSKPDPIADLTSVRPLG